MNTENIYETLEKTFPIGSKFIYNSKYGGKLERIVLGYFHITNETDENNPIIEYYIIDEKHKYPYKLEECSIN